LSHAAVANNAQDPQANAPPKLGKGWIEGAPSRMANRSATGKFERWLPRLVRYSKRNLAALARCRNRSCIYCWNTGGSVGIPPPLVV